MLLVPTNVVPQKFVEFIDKEQKIERKFINGYRNCITKDFEWILIKDDRCCGQTYCFKVKEDKQLVQKLSSYEKDSQKIETVQNNYILKSSDERRYNHQEPIQQEKLKKLVEEVGGNDVAKNLIINSFLSFQDFKKSKWFELPQKKQISKEEKTILQCRNREYVGKKLFDVPLYNKETGNWDDKETIKLKIAEEAQKPKEPNEPEIIIEG